jgi:hypothetical protein
MSPDPIDQAVHYRRSLTIEERAAQQNAQPMLSTEEWAADIFESDEELEAFLADVRASRDASPA